MQRNASAAGQQAKGKESEPSETGTAGAGTGENGEGQEWEASVLGLGRIGEAHTVRSQGCSRTGILLHLVSLYVRGRSLGCGENRTAAMQDQSPESSCSPLFI